VALKRILVFGAFNNVFFAGLGGVLTLAQLLLTLRFVEPRDMGEFAVAAAFALTLEFISDFGIGDRLIQQDTVPLRHAFQTALTAQLVTAIPLWAAVYLSAPAIAGFYGIPPLSGLIRLMSLQAFGGVLRLPLFLLTRNFEFFKHRLLLFLGKLVSFVVTVTLAFDGFRAWALGFGMLAGLLATSIPAWYFCPFRPAWRWRSAELRSMVAFSWPVWLSRVTMIGVEQGSVLVVSVYLSVSELGQYKSAEQLAHFAILIEAIFAQTVYPALCRVKEDIDRFSMVLSKTSRAAMVFLAPAGVALLIFPHQIVNLLLTSRWHGAELFLQAHGAGLLLGAIAFNWEAAFRATGNTGPIFRWSIIYALAFAFLFYPLTRLYGRPGAAAGVVAVNVIAVLVREYYFRTLRLRTSILGMTWRSLLCAGLAAVTVLMLRAAIGEASTFGAWTHEVMWYTAVYTALIFAVERHLINELREIIGSRNAKTIAA
jgi:O-antigen/teichoic acid export membrane protein